MKTRMLFRNYGAAGDLLYYANSGTNYTRFKKDYCLDYYYASQKLRNTPVGATWFDGREAFESSNNGRNRQNACFHSKVESVNLPMLYQTESYTRSTQYYYAPYHRKSSAEVSPVLLGQLRHRNSEELDPVRRRAWWNMQPRFQGQVSILNSLYELKDFREAARHLFARDQVQRIHQTKRALRNLLSKPTKAAAGAVLTTNLMITPTVKDLANIWLNASLAAADAQRRFWNEGFLLNKAHYTEKLSVWDNRTKYANNNYWFASGNFCDTTFTATLRYRYGYTMRNSFDTFLRYWGLAGSFEAFWNMIPYSFVWDYINNISKAIHVMEVDRNVDMMYQDYTESLLSRVCSGLSFTGDQRSNQYVLDGVYKTGNSLNGLCFAGHAGSLYQRFLRTPNKGTALPRLRYPSGKAFLNVAALARCMSKD